MIDLDGLGDVGSEEGGPLEAAGDGGLRGPLEAGD